MGLKKPPFRGPMILVIGSPAQSRSDAGAQAFLKLSGLSLVCPGVSDTIDDANQSDRSK